MRLYVYSTKIELKKFDDMNFQDQLQHAHQHQSLRTGSESRIQRLGFVNLDEAQEDYKDTTNDTGLRPPCPAGRPRTTSATGCNASQGMPRFQELLVVEAEDQSVTGTTKEKATPDERYLVSGARMRLFLSIPRKAS